MAHIFLRSCTKVKEVLSVNEPIEEDSEDDLIDKNMWLEMRRQCSVPKLLMGMSTHLDHGKHGHLR